MFNATLGGTWAGVFFYILLVLCFYFTLSFFEYLRKEDERAAKQSKISAVLCLASAVAIPVFFNFYIYNEMMQ